MSEAFAIIANGYEKLIIQLFEKLFLSDFAMNQLIQQCDSFGPFARITGPKTRHRVLHNGRAIGKTDDEKSGDGFRR